MEKLKKKILIHSLVFSPDNVSTAYIYNDIALGLKNSNYEVIVLTTTPHYNFVKNTNNQQQLSKKMLGLYYVSFFNEIKIIHVPIKKYTIIYLRITSLLYWHFLSLILALKIRNIDFIICPTPPPSIGIIGLLIAKIKKSKFIYNVQEVYPDILINQGLLKSKIFIWFLKKIEIFIYKYADSIIAIDLNFYNILIDRISNKKKLSIIPNFVDTDLYKPTIPDSEVNLIFQNSNKIKLLYAGNIGIFQDWEPILYAADKLKNTNIEFWIIGDGLKKNYLLEKINKLGLKNIILIPYLDRNLMPAINSFVDIHFISANEEISQFGFPSKVYTIMACAKPMIVITKIDTPLYNFLHPIDCSILITSNKNENFTNSIIKLSNNKNLQKKLGLNGYDIIQQNYTKNIIINMYIKILKNL